MHAYIQRMRERDRDRETDRETDRDRESQRDNVIRRPFEGTVLNQSICVSLLRHS